MPLPYTAIRPYLFRLDPETAHNITIQLLSMAAHLSLSRRWLTSQFYFSDPRLETEVFGRMFHNPVGIAAGYDKNAHATRGLAALGASHIEVGTVTPMPQDGFKRPRVFRIPEYEALINRMGFPNAGATAIAAQLAKLRKTPTTALIGVNIGKGRTTSVTEAPTDYSMVLRKLHPYADYVAVNVSSPNTPGLRQLQGKAALQNLMDALQRVRSQICPTTPMLVKFAPDMSLAELDDALQVITNCGASGVIATNTTTDHTVLTNSERHLTGGMSGTPLRDRSTAIIRHIYRQLGGSLPIIGVGGVSSAASALEKIRAGASLVQIYTGLAYHGPGLVREINAGLARELDLLGLDNIKHLVGSQS